MRLFLVVIYLVLICASISAQAFGDISGVWQHANKPALIEINLDERRFLVKQHSDNPESEGLTVIQKVLPVQKKESEWIGQMYNGYIDQYVPVSIRLLRQNTLAVYDAEDKEVLRLFR